ncbi:MAG: DUF4296 domain-containing protein [bacterium]|nr:DUF4296 domain-containing protein [bacterium]
MKKIFLIILVIVGLGCTKEATIPDDILPQEKMIEILIDIHLLEEKIDYLKLEKDTSLMLFKAYEFELLKEHEVDTAEYQKSYRWYASEVRTMSRMYETIVDSLNVRHKRVSKKSKVDDEGEPAKKRNRPRKLNPTKQKADKEDE